MNNSVIPYEERELIKRAIRKARPNSRSTPRWVMVKKLFGTGSTISAAICEQYGFDPDYEVKPASRLSDEEYEENLMQHAIEIGNK